MDNFDMIFKVLALSFLIGTLCSAFGLVGTASATTQHACGRFCVPWGESSVVTGSGLAGSGWLAVAAFFDESVSSGAGVLSGMLIAASGSAQEDLFALTAGDSTNSPALSCAVGEVSASGTVTSGSFQGDQVLVSGCIGTGVQVAVEVTPYHCIDCSVFSGQGTGSVTTLSSSIKGGVVGAGATSGSGSAGTGTIYTAEANALLSDGSILGGGAFVGSMVDAGGRIVTHDGGWQDKVASIGMGCTLNTAGVTGPFSSFPNQPVSSSYTLATCPPTSTGPQTAQEVFIIGSSLNPIYKGSGTATDSVHFNRD